MLWAGSGSADEQTRPEKRPCLQIVHIGDEDKPMPAIRICLSAHSSAASSDGIEWEFGLERTSYDLIEAEILRRRARFTSAPGRGGPLGTYQVSWSSAAGQGSYMVSARESRRFFTELSSIAKKARITKLADVLLAVNRRIP
jgi:hypothetical protein